MLNNRRYIDINPIRSYLNSIKAQSHAHSHFPLEYLKDKDRDIKETSFWPSTSFVLDQCEKFLLFFNKKNQFWNGCSGTLSNAIAWPYGGTHWFSPSSNFHLRRPCAPRWLVNVWPRCGWRPNWPEHDQMLIWSTGSFGRRGLGWGGWGLRQVW